METKFSLLSSCQEKQFCLKVIPLTLVNVMMLLSIFVSTDNSCFTKTNHQPKCCVVYIACDYSHFNFCLADECVKQYFLPVSFMKLSKLNEGKMCRQFPSNCKVLGCTEFELKFEHISELFTIVCVCLCNIISCKYTNNVLASLTWCVIGRLLWILN